MFEHLDNRQPRLYSEADRAEVTRRVARRRRRRRYTRLSIGTLAVIGVIVAAITFIGTTTPSRSQVRVGAKAPAKTTTPAATTAPTPIIPAGTVPVEKPTGRLLFPETAFAAGPSTIYVVGAMGDPCDCYAMDRTVNNGRSFTRVSAPAKLRDETIGFETPTDGYAITISNPGYGDIAGAWLTNNGARSWRAVKFDGRVGIVAVATTASALYLITTQCKGNGTCQCTHGCNLVRIRAGTTTATATRLPSTTSKQPYRSGTIGLAASGNNIWIFDTVTRRALTSTDGGGSFEPLALSLTGSGCHYSASSPTVLWSQCDDVEYRSDNGGRVFTRIRSAPHTYAWEPINATTIYTAAEAQPYSTIVLRQSTNAGQSFATVPPPTTQQYCDFTFSTISTGIALCYGGPHAGAAVFATHQGGRAWTSGAQP
jgi:hypothetical protein